MPIFGDQIIEVLIINIQSNFLSNSIEVLIGDLGDQIN